MRTALHISITESIPFSYEKAILQFIRTNVPAINVYDIDNHSESLTIQYAVDLLNQSDKCTIIIEASEAPAGSLRSLLQEVVEHPEKYLVLLNGKNILVERMLRLLKEEQVKKDLPVEVQQQQLIDFLG